MTLWAVLPVKRLEKGKSRLRPCLGSEELFMLNWTQFLSTFEKLVNCPEIDKVLVVSADEKILNHVRENGQIALPEHEKSSLNLAVSQALSFIKDSDGGQVLILPADLPWMTGKDLSGFIQLKKDSNFIAIVPDQKQTGTNAVLISNPGLLKPKFGENSFQKHTKQAQNIGTKLIVWLNKNIQRDLDTPQDFEFYIKIKPYPNKDKKE